jgi:hypothetical protein
MARQTSTGGAGTHRVDPNRAFTGYLAFFFSYDIMDLGSFRRGLPQTSCRSSASLDFGMLTAALQAYQAASVTARTPARAATDGEPPASTQDALVEILLGGPRWREAVTEQGGCFNAAYARWSDKDA